MTQTRIQVSPSVLTWARESIGLALPTAARKLGVSEATVAKWESGDVNPTISQLRKAAAVYRRPLAVLLLEEPPVDFQPLRDFRTTIGLRPTALSFELLGEVRRAHMQREVLLEVHDTAPDLIGPSEPVPRWKLGDDAEAAGASIRAYVGIGVEEQRSWSGPEEALRAWIQAVEERGILVIQTRGVAISEARGFSVGDWPYPIIGLNGADWPRPRIFTLFHELAHLSLGAGGVCDLHERDQTRRPAQSSEDEVEHYCNAVAGSALMPRGAVLNEPTVRAGNRAGWDVDRLHDAAKVFSVSSEALLLRLVALDLQGWAVWHDLKPALDERYREAQEAQRQRMRASAGGPSYYTIKARDLGRRYVATVMDAYRARAISSIDASHYLDVAYKQIGKLGKAVGL